MILRNKEYGSIAGASGIQGFFEEGYPFHARFRRIFGRRFSFNGMTFTAKTMTLNSRTGNMPLQSDCLTPVEMRPKCIYCPPSLWLKGAALNAVGLSNAGSEWLLAQSRWQERTDNFFLSFMSVEKRVEDRIREFKVFCEILKSHLPRFKGGPALQHNLSCPNVGLHGGSDELLYEAMECIDEAQKLGIPYVPKINLLTRPREIKKLADHPGCDGICVTNTLPWGSLADRIDWLGLFGTSESPLKRFGGGGLSGKPLLPLNIEWLKEAEGVITKPIIAGGGILGPEDIFKMRDLCLLFIPSLGSISFLRPWRVQATIQQAGIMF